MANVDPALTNSTRFRRFRRDLIGNIPRIPNNQASLNAIESKHPTDLLIIYMCWRLRNVAIRSRKVTGMSAIENDPRAAALRVNFEAFVEAVETGADLGPYLSLKAHRHGYVMASDPEHSNAATWSDKDFVLNVMGLHHFHLGLNMQSSGLMERTNEVLFASVRRDEFEILGLFDHSVFEWAVDDELVPERKRLWSKYDEMRFKDCMPGSILMDGYGNMGITTAGTPLVVTKTAIEHIKIIKEMDPKLDDSAYVQTLFDGYTTPRKIKLAWHYRHLDFGLVNEPSGHFILIRRGPN